MTLSPKTIDRLSAGRIACPSHSGLSIEVGSRGKVWRYRRRVAGSDAVVNIVLGSFPAHSIKDARQWAEGLNETVEAGRDPREAERAAKGASMTVGAAHALYMAEIARGDRKPLKPRTLLDKGKIWQRDIEPHLGGSSLSDVTANYLWELVERKGEIAPVRANRTAAELKVLFGWCLSRAGQKAGIRLVTDPSASLNGKHFLESKGRARTLSDEELGWFMGALLPEGAAARRAFLLMLLTGARIHEVIEASHGEYRAGIWTIPAERAKNSTAHAVALGEWGKRLFTRRVASINYDACRRARDRIHRRMEALAGRGVEHWTAHDLRRTLRSNTFHLGIRYEVAEAMMNHAKQGLERRYDLADLSAHMAAGFAAWETKLVRIAGDSTGGKNLDLPAGLPCSAPAA